MRFGRACFALLVALAAGCAGQAWVSGTLPTCGVTPGDAIAVLVPPPVPWMNYPIEGRTIRACAEDALAETFPDLRIVPAAGIPSLGLTGGPEASRALELREHAARLEKQLAEPAVTERLDAAAVRYVLIVSAFEYSAGGDAVSSGGFGGPAAAAYFRWTTSYDGRLFDRRSGSGYAVLDGEATGTAILMIPIPPFYIPSMEGGVACHRFQDALVAALQGRQIAPDGN